MASRARKRRLRRWRDRLQTAAPALIGAGALGIGIWALQRVEPGPQGDGSLIDGSLVDGIVQPLPDAPGGTVTPGAVDLEVAPPDERRDAEGGALCEGCDIVVITLCSLRRDHVSAYGEGLAETPALDRIAAGGARFTRAYAASNFTLASLTAVLTARFGSTTGVLGWDRGLVEDVPTLPEVLGYYGYRTGAFTIDAASGFRPDYGLHRGFQTMKVIPPPRDTPDGRFTDGPIGPGGATAAPAAAWIREQAAEENDAPIFAMLHSRTAHYPFLISEEGVDDDPTGVSRMLWEDGLAQAEIFADRPMPGMSGGTAQKGVVDLGPDPVQTATRQAGDEGVAVWRRAYVDAVERMDLDVQVVLDALEESGRMDRTIVVAVADHGESLGDHGELLHGDAYFDAVVRVPMLIQIPGLAGGRTIDALVSQADLAPTLLELVGAVPPADADGHSMVPLLTGEATAVDTVRSMTLVEGGVGFKDEPILRGAVIAPPWTLLRQDTSCGGPPIPRAPGEPGLCLFRRDIDPGQNDNLAREAPEVAQALAARWDDFRATRGDANAARHLSLDPEFVEMLQRTGYDFRPSGEPDPDGGSSGGDDP